MSTYNLFPGLKQILEDKRIRRFGVPDDEYQNYLNAEQFVVDMRLITHDEENEIMKTLYDLETMGLFKPPYESYLLHVIGYYYNGEKNNEYCDVKSFFSTPKGTVTLHNSEQEHILMYNNLQTDSSMKDKLNRFIGLSISRLIVMLATRNIVKQRHEPKASQAAINGKPHKKGSGGYTLLRPPESHEVGDGTGTHASPRPHFRRGHIRKLHPEDKSRWIFVSPCFVNGEPEVARKAYLA